MEQQGKGLPPIGGVCRFESGLFHHASELIPSVKADVSVVHIVKPPISVSNLILFSRSAWRAPISAAQKGGYMPILEIVIVLGLLTLTEILRAIAVRSKWLYQRGSAKNKR